MKPSQMGGDERRWVNVNEDPTRHPDPWMNYNNCATTARDVSIASSSTVYDTPLLASILTRSRTSSPAPSSGTPAIF